MGTITRQEATAKADAIYADYKKSGISPWSRRMDKPRDVSRIASEEKREFYVKKYEDQEGKCAICGDVCPHLFIDHCHRTGKLRALLCSRCNTAIGQLRDNPAIIRKAADTSTILITA
jgi:hypothetical protein